MGAAADVGVGAGPGAPAGRVDPSLDFSRKCRVWGVWINEGACPGHPVLFLLLLGWLANDAGVGVGADAEHGQVATPNAFFGFGRWLR